MQKKTLFYISLLIIVIGFLIYGITSSKSYRDITQKSRLIKVLRDIEPNYELVLYFSDSDINIKNKQGNLFKIYQKNEDHTFQIKSKSNHSFAFEKDEVLLTGFDQTRFDNINTISFTVLSSLLKNASLYTIYSKSREQNDTFSKYLKRQNLSSRIVDNLLGPNFGLDFLIRSSLILFLLMLGLQFILELISKTTDKDFSYALKLIGLAFAYRLIIFMHFGFEYNSFFSLFLPGSLFLLEIVILILPAFCYWFLANKINTRFDLLDAEFLKVIVLLVVGTGFYLSLNTIMNFVGRDTTNIPAPVVNSFLPHLLGILPLLALVFANLFHNIFQYYRSERKNNEVNKVRKSQVVKAEAKLNEIQSSVNPHFLYNSFNSIAALANKDPAKTEEMTLALSSFYKYTTNRQGQTFSTVEEEIEMVKNYLEIEKVRFDDRLSFDITIEEGIDDKKLPYFILQPLVENAIKYGYNKQTDNIEIKIEVSSEKENIILSVYDNGSEFDEDLSKGYGLGSVTKKLQLLYPNAHEISFNNEPKHVSIILNSRK